MEGEISYSQWRNEVRCLSSEGLHSDHIIRQAIKRSLKGLAADILLSLEEYSIDMLSIADILIKFDSVFGNVFSPRLC